VTRENNTRTLILIQRKIHIFF